MPHSSLPLLLLWLHFFSLFWLSPPCFCFSSSLPSKMLCGIGDSRPYLQKASNPILLEARKKKFFSACNWKQDHSKPNESFSSFQFLKLFLLSHRLKGNTLFIPSHNWTRHCSGKNLLESRAEGWLTLKSMMHAGNCEVIYIPWKHGFKS